MTNYRHNAITVNTQGHDSLDISDATQDVIPSKGAVVGVDFDARSGMRALLTLGNDSNLLIVFYVQIMPDDFVMQLHRF